MLQAFLAPATPWFGISQLLIPATSFFMIVPCMTVPTNWLVVQALSASAAGLIGISQLLVPAISFFEDMWPHTAGFGHNWTVLGVYVTCSFLVVAWTLFPNLFATSHGAVWHAFAFSFRWQFLVLIVCTNILAILLRNVRRCLQSRRWVHGSNAVLPLNY